MKTKTQIVFALEIQLETTWLLTGDQKKKKKFLSWMRHDLESCIMDFTEGCAHAWNILQIPQSSDKQGFIKLRGRGSSALSHPGKNKMKVGIM